MVGIKGIGSYIPNNKRSNYELKEKFQIDDTFIESRIGIRRVSVKADHEDTSDLCLKAFNELESKSKLDINEIECIIVVTQNPDYNLPHTSAIVHAKINAKENCACFDISLGCSGYVYGLSIAKSFMESNNMRNGLLFTADPYSKNINPDDKNTFLLFGDASTVTWLSSSYLYSIEKSDFGTIGKSHEELICRENKISMNGRAIFNFAARYVPKSVLSTLKINRCNKEDLDLVILHQGSKYIVDTLTKLLKFDEEKVPFDIEEYGNTISSSIPIILEKHLRLDNNKILLAGFGVGLSFATTILKLNKN